MTALLEVPVPDGELGQVQEAALDLERRALRVDLAATQMQSLAESAVAGWEGRTAGTFQSRVAEARRSLDGVSGAHLRAATALREYCDQWEDTDHVARQARRSIESASAGYRRDGRAAAANLADQISQAIKSLDHPVEDVPVLGDITDAVTSGAARIAHDLIDRLLAWNPDPPAPAMLPVAPGALDVGDLEGAVRTIASAAEWGVDAVLDGIGAVVELVGGVVLGAVRALEAVGEAFVEAVESALDMAGQAIETLFELGRAAARTLAEVAVAVGLVVFDAVMTGVEATVDFLISLGRTIVDVVELVLDGATTLGAGVLALVAGRIRERAGLDGPRMENPEAADRAAVRQLRFPDELERVTDRQELADWAYRTAGAPRGWERVENYTGPDGFYAVAFRAAGTDTVVVAYRGTNPDSLEDWQTDAFNAAELPTRQARRAIEVAQEVARDPRFKGQDIDYTGHSLGGSLASIASIATGRPARTFNAASIGAGNYAQALKAGGHGRSEEQIVNYHTRPDILTALQRGMGTPRAAGAQVTVASTAKDPVAAHGLESFDWSQFELPKQKVR